MDMGFKYFIGFNYLLTFKNLVYILKICFSMLFNGKCFIQVTPLGRKLLLLKVGVQGRTNTYRITDL